MNKRIAEGAVTESNIVRIPDPAKLLDPLYLTAHSLVDQMPRPVLAALMPALEQAIGTSPSSVKPQGPPLLAIVPLQRAGSQPDDKLVTGCNRLN